MLNEFHDCIISEQSTKSWLHHMNQQHFSPHWMRILNFLLYFMLVCYHIKAKHKSKYTFMKVKFDSRLMVLYLQSPFIIMIKSFS